MGYSVRYIQGHVEVFTPRGEFLFSADSVSEAYSLLEEECA